MVVGAPRGVGAAGARGRNARMATRLLLPRRLRATQRVAVQLRPRRAVWSRFKKATISRAEGGRLQRRVSPPSVVPEAIRDTTVLSSLARLPSLVQIVAAAHACSPGHRD